MFVKLRPDVAAMVDWTLKTSSSISCKNKQTNKLRAYIAVMVDVALKTSSSISLVKTNKQTNLALI